MELSKIEIVTSMSKLDDLKCAFGKIGVTGMTVITQALGCGVQRGAYEYETQKHAEMELLPKQLIMIVVQNHQIDAVVEIIKKELYTGHIGDGKIFITPLSNVIRVRTGEEGLDALK